MAAVNTSTGINGTYAPSPSYGSVEGQQQQQNGAYSTSQHAPNASNSTTSATSNAGSQAPEVAKDEVGWYFVEQYYTTLSRSPEKLHLFYNRRSQFVSGQETDKVAVCVGQRAINDKIKELDFQDCKVRVTNVDSQASDSNIVITVIGEISNKSQPHKKFVQTFVLATQTNGYFVLNDIFRYLLEEEDDVEQEPEQEPEQEQVSEDLAAVAPDESKEQESVPESKSTDLKTLTSSTDLTLVEENARIVDKEIETKLVKNDESTDSPEATVNGTVTAVDTIPTADAIKVDEASEEPSSLLAPEKPQEPEPTPAVSPLKQAAEPVQSNVPAAAPKPWAPKTWANLAAAANRVATPVAPAPSVNQPRAPAAATAVKPPPTAASVSASQADDTPESRPAEKRDESPASTQQDEWTAVGGTHARQQSRQVNVQQDGPQNRAYIKNVYEGVDSKELKSHLEKFGEITYFDIARAKVSRCS